MKISSAGKRKIKIIVITELAILLAFWILYTYLLPDFRYRDLLVYPMFLIMANSAVAINAFSNPSKKKKVKRKMPPSFYQPEDGKSSSSK